MLNNLEQVQDRINELVRLIRYYEHKLHLDGDMDISDEMYDSLRKELESLEGDYPQFLRPDSPSLYIGTVNFGCDKIIKRNKPMLSLRHTYNFEELQKQVVNLLKHDDKLIIEPKIDGVSLSVIYINSILDSISLRGNGFEGEDVTYFAGYIINLPLKLKNDNINCEIRGEVIVSKSLVPLNNRNYVAGNLRKKQATHCNLKFLPYELYKEDINNHEDSLQFLSQEFEIVPYVIINNIENLEINCNQIYQQDYEFFIDGVVIKMNNLTQFHLLGFNNRYPRGSIAYKFTKDSMTSVVSHISWNMNRSACLIPIINIEKINIEGSDIQKVHGHNKRNLYEKKIFPQSVINISMVGGVIPQVTHIIHSGPRIDFLTHCPFCQSNIVENDIHYVCINSNCVEKKKQQILFFFEKLDIDGMGPVLIKKLFNQSPDLIDIIKFLKTNDWVDSLHYQKAKLKFESMRKNISLKQLLIALGIENISDSFINKLQINSTQDLTPYLTDQFAGIKFNNLQLFLKNNYNFIIELYELLQF